MYRRPYPEWVGQMYEFPRGYKVPDFAKFLGEDNASTIEHVGRFSVQCSEAGSNEFLKLRLFANSLTESSFTLYVNLSPNSVTSWLDMETQFHAQFYRTEPQFSNANLSKLHQLLGESVEKYMSRFKQARHKCLSSLNEAEFVKLAQNGLSYELRQKFHGQEFFDLFQLTHQVSMFESLLNEAEERNISSTRTYYKDPKFGISVANTKDDHIANYMDFYTEDPGIHVAEILGGKPYVCEALIKRSTSNQLPNV